MEVQIIPYISNKIRKQPVLYRFILLFIFINITLKIINTDEYWFPFISNINFAFHEFGHIATMFWASQPVIAVAGSVMQCLIPMVFILLALKEFYLFDAAMMGVWIGTNLHYIGGYIIDAMRFEWPMSQFFGPDSVHDWNYLLTEWELLYLYEEIGNGVLTAARIISLVSIVIGIALLIVQIYLKIRYEKLKKEANVF